jgi:hypothetical protein
MKAYRGNRTVAPFILNLWMVNITSRSLYSGRGHRCPMSRTLGEPQSRSRRCPMSRTLGEPQSRSRRFEGNKNRYPFWNLSPGPSIPARTLYLRSILLLSYALNVSPSGLFSSGFTTKSSRVCLPWMWSSYEPWNCTPFWSKKTVILNTMCCEWRRCKGNIVIHRPTVHCDTLSHCTLWYTFLLQILITLSYCTLW